MCVLHHDALQPCLCQSYMFFAELHTCRASVVHVQEITRRVNLKNIWQAAYTAGAVLPKPVSTTQYWHRSLNPKKLISVGFSRLQVRVALFNPTPKFPPKSTPKLCLNPCLDPTPDLTSEPHVSTPQSLILLASRGFKGLCP